MSERENVIAWYKENHSYPPPEELLTALIKLADIYRSCPEAVESYWLEHGYIVS